jgi:hypothetical protein
MLFTKGHFKDTNVLACWLLLLADGAKLDYRVAKTSP